MGARLSDARRSAVLALFTLSGATALASQLVWMRMLAAFVGARHLAASLVLAVFMAGLALGAAIAGPKLDRVRSPLASYGRIEIAIGSWTLAMPLLSAGAARIQLAFAWQSAFSEALSSLLLAVLLLGVPTLLMGATLPAVIKALGRDRPSATAGEAYSLNVLGAVLGALAAGVWGLPSLGVTLTNSASGSLSLLIGLSAILLARGAEIPAASQATSQTLPERSRRQPKRPLAVAALSGMSALALEVIWMRALGMLTADTTLAQTATLAGYLFGLAIGGRLSALFVERVKRAWSLIALCQLAIAAYALASPVLLDWIGREIGWRSGSASGVFGQLALASAFFVLPAALSGASLVFLFRVSLRDFAELGGQSGRLASANAIGAMLGALAAGLIAIPLLGSQRALAVSAALSLAAATIALSRASRRAHKLWYEHASWLFVGVVLALGAWLLRSDRFRMFGKPPPGTEIVFAEEDAYGLAEVRRGARGELVLVTDRRYAWGSTQPLMVQSMLEQGRLPLVLHPQPRTVIEIGIGTGISFAPILRHPVVERAEMIEISPAVARAARLFAAENADLHLHPKLSLVIGDGRKHLLVTEQRYDVIVLGLFTPYRAGAGYLFSRELYRACKQRLNPGGLLVHWLPLDQLSPTALASIFATFASEFSVAHAFDRIHYLALVGASQPLALDANRSAVPEAKRALSSYLFGRSAIEELGRGAPLSTDDRPFVELHPASAAGLAGRRLAVDNLERVLAKRHRPHELVRDPGLLAAIEQSWLGRERLIRGGMAQAKGDHQRARRLFAEALELSPNDELARGQLESYAR